MKETEQTIKEIKKPKKALLAFSHADDAEQFAGGTARELQKKGVEVVIVDMTNGNRGTKEHSAEYVSAIRHKEAIDAAKILGVNSRINLGLDDSFLQADHTTLLQMVDVIREQNPDIVLTHARDDMHHRDHKMTAHLMTQAVRLSGFANLQTKYEPTEKRIDVFYSDPQYATTVTGQYAPMGVFVSLSDDARNAKQKAFLAHTSQNLLETPGVGKGELTHVEMTKRMEELRGLQIRVPAAEAFTQLVDSDHPPVAADRHPLVQMIPGRVYILSAA